VIRLLSTRLLLLGTVTGLALALDGGGASAAVRPVGSPVGAPAVRAACGQVAAPRARCYALYRSATARAAAAAPEGFGPADLQAAYRLPSATAGAGQTVAIVDAFDDPSAEADLAVYRDTFGLPPCTTANGCFRKVSQRGQAGPLPDPDPGWAVEISLDLDMVSAACPKCNILLVEGDQPAFQDLGTAVDTAVRLGAAVVSNSYGTDEFNGMQTLAHFYRHPGTTITVSSGDSGFGPAAFPAVLTSVVAVGGTSLTRAGNARGWAERVWDGAGSGCSAYIAKPAWQHDGHCDLRTVADVSAVADPNTGVAVYDTFEVPGWIVVGGTSASAPLIGGVYALAGNATKVDPSYPYAHRNHLFDVVGGSNGFCGRDYLCTGKKGYDAPTGLGTPNGAGAF
jgi:subtilase family serine protease